MSVDKFKVSIKRGLNGKPDSKSGINLATNFEPLELSSNELIKFIKNGDGFSAQYKNNYRQTKNFICSGMIAADFDYDYKINEVLKIDFVKENASFLYTTASHTIKDHRFRVVFLLEKTIEKSIDWADCLLGLAIKIDSDRTIKDAGRLFYGNPSAKIHNVGTTLIHEEVEKLIMIGRDHRKTSTNRKVSNIPSQSSHKISDVELLKTSDGYQISLSEIEIGKSVYCPVHYDKRPSAFIVRSNSGGKGVHCMACNKSFWSDCGDEYDFDAFDKLVANKIDIDNNMSMKIENSQYYMESLFPPNPQVEIFQKRFLPNLHYKSGVTLVKSPKGSGKTEALKNLVKNVLDKKYLKNIPKKERSLSILLIGHRRSLIREASKKLGLNCYLDGYAVDFKNHKDKMGFAICLDSLHQITEAFTEYVSRNKRKNIKPKPYDLVIIDESEQVFSHLLSETISSRVGISRTYSALDFALTKAKSVIALDADLGLVTAHALKNLRPLDWENSFRIIINKPQQPNQRKKYFVYKSKSDLIDRILTSIRNKKRCFIASNSKNMIDILCTLINNEFKNSVKIMFITSDNSRNEIEANFVENIKTEYLNYQVLLCSPSLGTGIDISFSGDSQEVDEVVGFFYSFVNTHTDIDQQISRVRNPKSVSVWFDSAKFNYETNFDVVRDSLARHHFVPAAVDIKLSDDGNIVYNKDHPLLMIAAHTTCAQRSSKKNLYKLFEKLRNDNGWEVEIIEKIRKIKPDKKWSEAKQSVSDRRVQGIMNAIDLSDADFLDLAMRYDSGDRISKDEKFMYERGSIQRFFNIDINKELIIADEKHKLRNQVRRFKNIIDFGKYTPEIYNHLSIPHLEGELIKKQKEFYILIILLFSCRIIEDGKINSNRIIIIHDLVDFVKICLNNKFLIEETFKIVLRDDFTKNPIRQLNVFLDFIGLKFIKSKRRKKAGHANFEYVFDHDRFKFIHNLSLNFKEVEKYKNIVF